MGSEILVPLALVAGLLALLGILIALLVKASRDEARASTHVKVSDENLRAYEAFRDGKQAARDRTRSERLDGLLDRARRRRAAGTVSRSESGSGTGTGQDGADR